jgi:hypothetical protein
MTSKDLLEEERMKAIQNLEKYQKKTESWYNKKVKPRQLSPRDFVLKKEMKTQSKNFSKNGKDRFSS